MAGCLLFLCETLRVWILYTSYLHVCCRLFELNQVNVQSLPIYFDNPLQILEDTYIEFNLYRWVVYMIWLQKSGKPFTGFSKL